MSGFRWVWLCGLLWASVVNAQEWEWISPQPQGNMLWDISMISDTEGWIVGESELLLHTSNGGQHWETLHRCGSEIWAQVEFVSATTGWILSRPPSTVEGWSIRKTTDGGHTWQLQYADPTLWLNHLHFYNDQLGWAAGSRVYGSNDRRPVIARTVDGGSNWTVQELVTEQAEDGIYDLEFVGHFFGWATTTSGHLFRTLNAGTSWLPWADSSFFSQQVDFVDLEFGIASSGRFVRTTDAGATWTDLPMPNPDLGVNEVAFGDRLHGCVSNGTAVYRTSNGGQSWDLALSSDFSHYMDVQATGPQSFWVIGVLGDILYSSDGGVTWEDQRPTVVTRASAMAFVDDNHGWVADLYSPALRRTSDAGLTWETLPHQFARRMQFVDISHGWTLSDSTLYATTDGGYSWQAQFAINGQITGLSFVNLLTGWIVCSSGNTWNGFTGRIFHTTDGGQSWQMQWEGPMARIMSAVAFADLANGWAVADGGYILLHTTDGGGTWQEQLVDTARVHRLAVIDDQHAWAVGLGGGAYSTTDGGNTWRHFYSPYHIVTVAFTGAVGCLLADGGIALHTTDGGVTWTETCTGSMETPFWATITPNGTTWAYGTYSGAILRHTVEIVPAAERHPALPENLILTTFPNPFNASVEIQYTLPRLSNIELTVFNSLGQQVTVLETGRKEAGSHRVLWNASGMASGIYFCRLKTDGIPSTRKMLLLR